VDPSELTVAIRTQSRDSVDHGGTFLGFVGAANWKLAFTS
jgi:hypothetical protein